MLRSKLYTLSNNFCVTYTRPMHMTYCHVLKSSCSEFVIFWNSHILKFSCSEFLMLWSCYVLNLWCSEVVVFWSFHVLKLSSSEIVIFWSSHVMNLSCSELVMFCNLVYLELFSMKVFWCEGVTSRCYIVMVLSSGGVILFRCYLVLV